MRTWTRILVLAPSSFDVNQVIAFTSLGGAVVLYRDLSNPPGDTVDPDTGDPVLGGWTGDRSQPPPDLARAVGQYFGKRPNILGRKGARICYHPLTGDTNTWVAQLAAITTIVNAMELQWSELDLILVLSSEDASFTVGLNAQFPSIPVVYPVGDTPLALVVAILASGV